MWVITGEPDYRLRYSNRGKFGATLDPGAWAGAQITPPDWVRESSKAYRDGSRRRRLCIQSVDPNGNSYAGLPMQAIGAGTKTNRAELPCGGN
jgi:hypothetical protein